MTLSWHRLRHLLTGKRAARATPRLAARTRPQLERLEGRELPSSLLPADMRIIAEGQGGGTIGMLFVSSQKYHGLFQGTSFAGTVQDGQFNNGHGIAFKVSGNVREDFSVLHPTLRATFSGGGALGLESESARFTGTYDAGTQVMTGTLDRTFTLWKAGHHIRWTTETPVEIVPYYLT
jgi:hypothetical protein